MVHRSIVSTMERMVAHLLEVHNGALPVWLAPEQVAVLPATSGAFGYARQVKQLLVSSGLRAEVDDRDATLAARVRDAQQRKAPYIAVVGQREEASGNVAVRLRSSEQLPAMSLERFTEMAGTVIAKRGAALLP